MHGFQCALLNDSDSNDPLKAVANIYFEHMGLVVILEEHIARVSTHKRSSPHF